jgi:hypothetical protein
VSGEVPVLGTLKAGGLLRLVEPTILVRNWGVSAVTLAAGSPALSIAAGAEVNITRAMAANVEADWTALEAQRATAGCLLEYVVAGRMYTGSLFCSTPDISSIDNLARLPPAGYVHRFAYYRISNATTTSNLVHVVNATRGAEHFYDQQNIRNYWRPPYDAYTRRLLSRGVDYFWACNRTTASTTEPNQGWSLNTTTRGLAPQSSTVTVQSTGIVPCSYGKSYFWNNTTNSMNCSLPQTESLATSTLQFWWRPMVLSDGASNNGVGSWTSSSGGWRLWVTAAGVLKLGDNTGTEHVCNTTIVAGNVYMITIVFNCTTFRYEIYVNGVLDSTATTLFISFVNGSDFIRFHPTNAVGASNMYVQYISVRRSLEVAADILADYEAGTSSPE